MSMTASAALTPLTIAPAPLYPNNAGAMDDRQLKDFGLRVRRRREALTLTRQALCEKAGITRTTLRQLEAGLQHPTPRTLARLVKALMVPEEALTGATPIRLDHPLLADLTEEDLSVAQRFHHASTRVRRRILDALEQAPSRLRPRALADEPGGAAPSSEDRDARASIETRLADVFARLDTATLRTFVDVFAAFAEHERDRHVVESTPDHKRTAPNHPTSRSKRR